MTPLNPHSTQTPLPTISRLPPPTVHPCAVSNPPSLRCVVSAVPFPVSYVVRCCQTAAFALGALSRVDAALRYPQVLVVVPTRELALQVHSVLSALAKYTPIQVYLAVPAHADAPREREKISAQVVVGTPGKLQSKLQHRDIDPRHVRMFIADEADQMVAQEGFADITIAIKK